jgi:hypothetical protein
MHDDFVARAAAFEHWFRGAVFFDGLYDFHASLQEPAAKGGRGNAGPRAALRYGQLLQAQEARSTSSSRIHIV